MIGCAIRYNATISQKERAMPETKVCASCSSPFVDISVRQTSRFCSRACVMRYVKTVNTKYPQTIEQTCEHCGKVFQASHKKVRQGKGRFCSVHCRAKMAARKPVDERFWANVQQSKSVNDCWLWTGNITVHGYGFMSVEGKIWPAHRLSYTMHYGPIPDGLLVCHACNTPRCVRPNHLYLGSDKDNARDKVLSMPLALRTRGKMTSSTVKKIRNMATQGVSKHAIAKRFGLSYTTVWAIVTRKTWAHIP